MKKRVVSKILTFFLAICTCVGVTSCKPFEPRTKEDLIPKSLGASEGLYLYYDNYRSLTDGTQTERLVCDITVDGVTYATDEYYIQQIKYATNQKEILYSLTAQKENEEEKYFLWRYNYDTKESGLVRAFTHRVYVWTSESYIFAKSRDAYSNGVEGVLYDSELNFVQDGLENYVLYGDTLYSYTDKSDVFYWWKNGRFFSVQARGGRLYEQKVLIGEKYAYLFPDYSVYAIDLDTGEYARTDFEKGEEYFDGTTDYGAMVKSGENVYFITYTKLTESEYQYLPLSTGCYFWKLRGLQAERIYAFPENYQVSFSTYCSERYINFDTEYMATQWYESKNKRKYGGVKYDVETGEFVYGSRYEAGPNPKERFRIGEYEFYIDTETYGALLFPQYCYYLHRVKDGKDEIMQYYFEDDDGQAVNPTLFDDIYVK